MNRDRSVANQSHLVGPQAQRFRWLSKVGLQLQRVCADSMLASRQEPLRHGDRRWQDAERS
jgi:hypothetical protein